MNERKRDAIITSVLAVLIVASTSLIIAFRNASVGQVILDSLAIIAGIFQAIAGIFVFKGVGKSYLKMLAFLIIMIGIATAIIHIMRIAPVEVWKMLGVMK